MGTSTPPRFLVVLGIAVLGLFLATAYQWTVKMNRRMEAREAIGWVQEVHATNLTEEVMNTTPDPMTGLPGGKPPASIR